MLEAAINWPPAGIYVLAVSGGADSVALARLMASAADERDYRLVVAHFDHGMRAESFADADFVAALARQLGLECFAAVTTTPLTGEASARTARYRWLDVARERVGARAVITAHHRDDLIETSLLNLARGSGWRGLAPLRAPGIIRPLLAVTRAELRTYLQRIGQAHQEDPSNNDLANPRNLLRHELLPAASSDWTARYSEVVAAVNRAGSRFEQLAAHAITTSQDGVGRPVASIDRRIGAALGLEATAALLAYAADVIRPGLQLRRRTLDEAALLAVTGHSGQSRDLGGGLVIFIKPLMVRLSFGFSALLPSK